MTDTVAIEFTCHLCKQPGMVPLQLTGFPTMEAMLRRMVTKQCVHDECADKALLLLAERRKAMMEEANAKRWETLCPAEFRKPIKYTNTTANKKFFNRIYAWRALTGLWVHGKPGLCKTRFVWCVLKRYFDDEYQIFAISHSSFRQRITGLAASEQHEMVKWMYRLVSVDILFLDDFGKGNTTNASEEAMFDLLNARYEKNKVTVFTSEFTREDVAKRFSVERAGSIQRRLEEMSEAVFADEF